MDNIDPTDKFLSFPDNLKVKTELFGNCLHFACIDPITIVKGSNKALATTYREKQKSVSSASLDDSITTNTNLIDIYMYKPLMVTKLSHNYEGISPGIIDNIISAITASASPTSKKTDNPSIVDKVVDGADAGASALMGSLMNLLDTTSNVSSISNKGQIKITPQAQMYKGTENRTQSFNFKMTPRNPADLKSMAKIIYYFHYYSLPTLLSSKDEDGNESSAYKSFGSSFYDVPKMWTITEMFGGESSSDTRDTPRFVFGPAAIQNVEYNMTPDDYSKTLKGTAGDPSAIELTVTFIELIPMDSDLYQSQQTHTNLQGLGNTEYKG